MALKKTIITDNGIETSYHRIVSIGRECITTVYNVNQIGVVLHSYKDESYRELEKEWEKVLIRINQLNKQIDELAKEGCADENRDEFDQRAGELFGERDRLVQSTPIVNSYHIYDISLDVELETTDELSFTDVYDALKNTDKFKDAVDC